MACINTPMTHAICRSMLSARESGRSTNFKTLDMVASRLSISFSPFKPLADGSFGDPQGCGDFLLPPPLLAQLPGTQASSFPPIGCMG